eukprot:Platyproteum_vivax@DN6533_c0_g1_i1.p1
MLQSFSKVLKPSQAVRHIRIATSFSHGHIFLNEDQIKLKDSVHEFVKAEIEPIAAKIDKEDSFPRDLWPKLGDFGLLGPTVPETLGGLGLSYLDHVVIMEQISAASGGVGLSYGAHSNLCVNQLNRWGTSAQKERFLPKLISGEHLGGLAISEPGAGSDAVSLRCAAKKTDGGYLLTGNKMWITNGISGNIFIVYAKTQPQLGSKGITTFIVEKKEGDQTFYSAQKLDKLGMRGSETAGGRI